MSQLLILLNRIKKEVRPELLTDTQRIVWGEVWQRLRFPERINLCGAAGVGKTFLAWAMAQEKNFTYFASPNAIVQTDFVNESTGVMIIDNGVSETGELRRLLGELQMRNGRSALIITRHPNQIGLPIVYMPPPTSEDISIVYHNLSLLEQYALPHHIDGNLWQIVHSTLT